MSKPYVTRGMHSMPRTQGMGGQRGMSGMSGMRGMQGMDGTPGMSVAQEAADHMVTAETGSTVADDMDPRPAAKEKTATSSDCESIGVFGRDCTPLEVWLAALKTAPLAYNRPTKMVRSQATELSLFLDPSLTADLGQELKDTKGEIREGSTKYTRTMSARLMGIDFDIETQTDEKQMIRLDAPTRWTWKVMPTVGGDEKYLTLDIFVYFEDENNQISDPVRIRTYRDKIVVKVKVLDKVTDLINKVNPIYAFLVAMTPAAGWFFMWSRKRKKEVND